MEGGQGKHSWHMGVVTHSYYGFGRSRDGHGGWQARRKKPRRIVCMSKDAGVLPECEVKTMMTPNHTAFQVHSSG